HREQAPHDRWELLVSSDELEPWSRKAVEYIAKFLKRQLTAAEIVRIARIVALPTDSDLVSSLTQDDHISTRIRGLHPSDYLEEAIVIWPMKEASRRNRFPKSMPVTSPLPLEISPRPIRYASGLALSAISVQ